MCVPVLNCVFLLLYGFVYVSVNPIHQHRLIITWLLYWIIILLAILSRPLLITVWLNSDFYQVEWVNVSGTGCSLFILGVIVLVSNSVLINSIVYLGINDNILFLIYIVLFQFSMLCFILSNDLIINFINWDLLGIVSYLLINYWSGKVNSGIKAIVYNKVGDIFFVLWLALFYDFFSSTNYHAFLCLSFVQFYLVLFYYSLFAIPILLIIFSKSAQLPFTSWLLNAMSAPTPISALLHSSTMVIAGVWVGLILAEQLICLIFLYYFP
jgi:NADH:ubiquinone oxidoreductase subunit 5 (subunit L)/multisubunit Na+/H+ antiporter MnhA subunit